MSCSDDAIRRFERHLGRAMDDFAGNLRQRLGTPDRCDDPTERHEMVRAWQAEETRLRRMAGRRLPHDGLCGQAALWRLLALSMVRRPALRRGGVEDQSGRPAGFRPRF